MILPILSAAGAIRFEELGLSPIAIDLWGFPIRWYSLAYLVGILLGYAYMLKLISRPGAPMARRHVDDLLFYATLGVILGGRIGYVLFYRPELLSSPLDLLKLWEGGMSFHGGLIGVLLAIGYLCWRNRLSYVHVGDYVVCCVPFGLLFGRIANFINGELWGRPTDVSWAIIFPGDPTGLPRHPSQLYEAGLEGLVLMLVLAFLFWKTKARHHPGVLSGTFLLGYGLSRFLVEFFRNPDAQLVEFAARSGLSMGQWLTVPMILAGLYLIFTSGSRNPRPVTG